MSAAVEIKHRLPRRVPIVGDARLGVAEPIKPPLQVRVLCAYTYWQAFAGVVSESTGFLIVTVRSSRAIRQRFTEAMSLELADWKPQLRGPRPGSYEFAWYLPENGRSKF